MFSLIILIRESLCDVLYECMLNSTEKLQINQFLSFRILSIYFPNHITGKLIDCLYNPVSLILWGKIIVSFGKRVGSASLGGGGRGLITKIT